MQVLHCVNLQVDRGEILGIVGPNGAGKTTLLKILCGLLLPTDGQVRVMGFDITRENCQVRSVVGYVPADERSFPLRLTGFQNLEFFAKLQNLHGIEARQAVMHALEEVRLSSLARYSPGPDCSC